MLSAGPLPPMPRSRSKKSKKNGKASSRRSRSRSPSPGPREVDLTSLELRIMPEGGQGDEPLWVAVMTCAKGRFVMDPKTHTVKMTEFQTCMPWPGKGEKSPTPAEIKRKLNAWAKAEKFNAAERKVLANADVAVDPKRHVITLDVRQEDMCAAGYQQTCTPRAPGGMSRKGRKKAGRAFSRTRRGRQSKHLRTLENKRSKRRKRPGRRGRQRRSARAGTGFADSGKEDPDQGMVDLTGVDFGIEEEKPKPGQPRTPPALWG